MTKIVKRYIAYLLIAVIPLITSCNSDKETTPLPETDFNAPIISNGGLAARQGEWIYYLNGDNFTREQNERFHAFAGSLCRMRRDASDKDVVVDADVSVFTLTGERIQLCVFENGQSYAASVKTDGTGYRKLKQIDNVYNGGCYACAGGYVYFTQDFRLYRMNEDGTDHRKLTDFPVYNLRASEKYAYFTRDENGSIGTLFFVSHGQDEPIKITEKSAYVLYAQDDVAFFYNFENGYVYRFDALTGEKKSVTYGGYTEYAFSDQFYAVSIENDDTGALYAIPAGGGNRVLLCNFFGKCMVFAGDHLYFINASKLNYLYRCSLDGSCAECVSEEFVLDIDTLDVVDEYIYFFSDSDYDRVYRFNTQTRQTECVELEEYSVVGE